MIPKFSAEASLTVGRPYPRAAKTQAVRSAAVYPQMARLAPGGAGDLRADDGGGVSCKCPCCIITGGNLYCC